jgi:hypothetical protein
MIDHILPSIPAEDLQTLRNTISRSPGQEDAFHAVKTVILALIDHDLAAWAVTAATAKSAETTSKTGHK